MQCRDFFMMADLHEKYYTVKSLAIILRLFPLTQKRYFISQNAIAVKK